MKHQLTEQHFMDRFQNVDFVLKTQAQIAKDFERLGYNADPQLLTTAFSLEDLTEVVKEMLAKVIVLGETHTLQLLYTVDLSQSKFLALTTDPDFLPKVSSMIIRREAQKVYLRSIY